MLFVTARDDSHDDGAGLFLVPREHSDASGWLRRSDLVAGGGTGCFRVDREPETTVGWLRRREMVAEAAHRGHVMVVPKTREGEAAREWVTSTPTGFLGRRDAESKAQANMASEGEEMPIAMAKEEVSENRLQHVFFTSVFSCGTVLNVPSCPLSSLQF